MLQAYLAELMVDLFGEPWLAKGRLDLKFVRLVEVDDRIVARGTVTSRDDDGFVEIELWCENQHGDMVCTGTGWTDQT